jgi:pyridoxal phosphate enzyme (YggS family)
MPMSELVQTVRARYLEVLDRIAAAAKSAGREPESVRLVVVTKGHPAEIAGAAIEAGATVLGENYPEEGVSKMQSLTSQTGVEWHMIGHVQSRKARLVAEHFKLVHSIDSVKLAERLDRFAGELGLSLPALLEFNVGGEESKSGWHAADENRWNELFDPIASLLVLKHLQIRGLMVMPPISDEAEASRVYFVRTRRLQELLRQRFPENDWSELSIGTSLDYEVAVQEGATLVRVGSAIVGPRDYNKET